MITSKRLQNLNFKIRVGISQSSKHTSSSKMCTFIEILLKCMTYSYYFIIITILILLFIINIILSSSSSNDSDIFFHSLTLKTNRTHPPGLWHAPDGRVGQEVLPARQSPPLLFLPQGQKEAPSKGGRVDRPRVLQPQPRKTEEEIERSR